MAERKIIRLEPIPDQIDVNHKKLTIFTCPRCGNQVNRHAHRMKCPYCFQKLAWPGIKYDDEGDDSNE